jgi:hypothetical protein
VEGSRALVGRIIGILGSCLALTALLAWTVTAVVGPAALERGKKLYYYRGFFDRMLTTPPPPRERPLLLWLGDSTIVRFSRPSYPQLLIPRVRTALGADTLVVAFLGFDPFAYYFVVGELLEAVDPSVVAIVAHLRAFGSKKGHTEFRYNDLSSYVPPRLLPRTLLLPLSDCQLSPARVLLAQALRFPGLEQAFYTAEGLRLLYGEAPFWAALGAPALPFVYDPRESDVLAGYELALSRRQPAVEMLEATVRGVTASGRVALVVASPIPVEAMSTRPSYDAAAIQRSVDVLRVATEDAGGMFADLHRVLAQDDFKDFGGHYMPSGALRTSNAVWPYVREALRRAHDRRPS